MCIGTPLQLEGAEPDAGHLAWAAADGQRELLDMSLLGPQPAGTWVLAFQGAARQVLTPRAAAQAHAGRQALAAVQRGDFDVDAFFADLVQREPRLPPHLLPAETSSLTPGESAP